MHNPTPNIVPFPAVNAVILNEKKEILVTRRSPIVREPGQWCLPGGHLDGGEDWVTACRREVKEEVGLDVLAETLIGIYSDPKITVTDKPIQGKGFRGQFVVASFLVTSFFGEVQPNDEVDKWEWVTLENLPKPFLRSHPIRIEDALKFTGKVFVR